MSDITQKGVQLFQDPAVAKRKRNNYLWQALFIFSTAVAIVVLITLLLTIINSAFGLVAIENEVEPEQITPGGFALEELSNPELIQILEGNLSKGLIRRFIFEKPLAERSQKELLELIQDRIVNPSVIEAWTLSDSLFKRGDIAEYMKKYPSAHLEFRSWVNLKFLTSPQSSVPEDAGIRTALLGSIWMIIITIVFSFPIGIGAAIYLEEYAEDNRLNRLIQTNIYNLSGVPSIIYGLLGLAIFVRVLEPLTSGSMFGAADPSTANGRTILSAGLTLSLLILPIIIINAQEALRALPNTLRYSSYGLGATKWQTIWHHLLPVSIDRIFTGTILAVSRAIGETAPLVVVGASTFIVEDPASIFSKFTTLPIQIYQWTARPQAEFRNIAAAAIIILLVLLLTMNTFAIVMRNKYSKQKRIGS